MPTLLQHRLDPNSRLIRLVLSEYSAAVELEDVSHWRRDERLTDLNPAATVPTLITDGLPAIIGISALLHFVEERFAPPQVTGLMPIGTAAQSEMWRMLDWILMKFSDEVTRYVLEEKIAKRELKQGTPDPSAMRAAKVNLSEHLQYFAYLLATRRWLCGEEMTWADFALAAHLSTLDYLGNIDWESAGEVKLWYARMKSRPAFRTLLTDRVVGMPASSTYADLDF